MSQPPAIPPVPQPGPNFDPMDQIVQNLENIESFLGWLEMHPDDLHYLNSHLPGILSLRRTISHQLEMLSEEPYHYPASRLNILHQENETLFIYVEGVVGAMNPLNKKAFHKALKAAEEVFLKFDQNLTP